ncbi:type II restriction enzyme XamI, partial [mine drainage metagenome]
MTNAPLRWTTAELAEDAATSSAQFRAERLAVSDSWGTHYTQARGKFELLFEKLSDLNPGAITDDNIAEVYGLGLGEALRYLAGPPISDDDLQVIADVDSIAPGVLKKNPEALHKVFEVIERVIDPYRFPWMGAGGTPTEQQRAAALLASSVLLAAQR